MDENEADRAIKIHPEYHLIVTEGTDTEPAYFGMIKEIINKKYPEKIQLNVSGAGEYEKNRKDMYQVLRPYMEYAIGNAKRLNAINKGKLPSKAAPGTKVYELIEVLKMYLEE